MMAESLNDFAGFKGTIHATFSRSHVEVRWTDRREMTFAAFAEMLREPPVGQKTGSCYTPATFSGAARRMDQAEQIDMAVLDSDCGHTLQEIEAALRKAGWAAVVHSTYNHLNDQTAIAAAPAEKWLAEHPGQSVSEYLTEKKGYLPRVVVGAEIVNEVRDGSARNLIVRHQPCHKYRVIMPLEQPWRAGDFPSQQAANARWRERVGALAHALSLHHDQSCVDTSRLFYLPRKSTVEAVFEFAALPGQPCQIFALADAVAPPEGLFTAPPSSPRQQPVLQTVTAAHKLAASPDGEMVDLTVWAAQFASRFQIVDLLKARRPGNFTTRRSGVKHHIICPNSGDHITTGEDVGGTYCVNAGDIPQSGLTSITGFVVHCMHAGCAGHDRLDHMKALIESGKIEVDDLSNEDFLLPLPAVDLSGLLQKHARPRASVATQDGARPSNIPAALYSSLPGVMREMHDYIVATAVKPQPALALASVLTMFGAAIGRKAELAGMRVRANIYALAVAHSGAGKERLLSAPKEVAQQAAMYKIIGVEEVASDSGIINAVIQQPNQVMLLDEVSFLFGATNNKQAGVHIVNVTSTLLKLYSSSRTRFKGKSYADLKMVQSVDQPCVSFLGCATPAGLFSALSSKDVSNGLLSRCVLFDAGDHDPLGRVPENRDAPAGVIDWIRAWDGRPLNTNPMERIDGELVIRPIMVPMTDEATSIAEEFEREMHGKKIEARDRGTDSLYVRARENALKFALVAACSVPAIHNADSKPVIDETALVVNGETMRWACELSRVTITAMETGAREEIVDTQFQQRVREIRNVIRKARETGLTMRELSRTGVGKMPQRDLQDVLHTLTSAETVFSVTTRSTGRPRSAFIHKDFVESPK